MNKAINDIFTNASMNAVAKGSNVLKLKKLYEKYNPIQFRKAFLHCCLNLMKYGYKRINHQVERCLQFAAEFCGNCYNSEEADEVDQFVVDLIDNFLLYHNNIKSNVRFYICKIIRLIIDCISANLRDDVCDRIQLAMFDRMNDPSSSVREQAVLAIARLQRPDTSDCAVISKYLDRITSEPNATVRKAIVQKVAITDRTLPVLYQCIWSVDAAVRSAAYLRCSKQEPFIFEIEQRQCLVMQIAFDENVPNRAILERRLWPKWLNMCRDANLKAASKSSLESIENTSDRNMPEKAQLLSVENDTVDACLMMMRMLRLDESVDKLQQTYTAFKVVLKVHFKLTPIIDLIQAIKLDSNNLMPLEGLTLESVFYWKFLLNYLQKSDKSQDSQEIVADLTVFCEYIDNFIKNTFTTNTSSTPYDEFMWLPNQHILLHLLEMLAYSDLHDDFGRERLKQLLSDILKNPISIHEDVVIIIVQIYNRIERKFEMVCDYFYGVITDIMRPYKVVPLDDSCRKERDFTLAKLKFDLAIADDEHNAAIESKNYLQAGECHNKIVSLREKIAAVQNDAQLLAAHQEQQRLQQQNGRRLREAPTTDRDKLLRCCELLCAVLKLCHSHSCKIPPILYTAKMELLEMVLESKDNELFAKALDTLTYYSLLDKDIAEEAIIIMSSPIITYRLLPHFNVTTLTTALTGFTYILIEYGQEILSSHVSNEHTHTANANELSQTSSCSRIVRVNRVEDLQLLDLDLENISIEDYQAIILDMLDDENTTVSVHAAICITTLLQNDIFTNSAVISQIFLKWFTPELYKSNPKLLCILSAGISRFGKTRIANIGSIMEEAAMCSLRCLIETSVESSLYSCNLPKCLQFLATVTMLVEPNKSEVHRNLAQKIIPHLNSDSDIRSKEIYSKFLSYMDAPLFDVDALKRFDELLQNTETKGLKTVRANITKYLSKLRNIYNGTTTDTVASTTEATSSFAITTTHLLPTITNPQTDMHHSIINEVINSPPNTPLLANDIENRLPHSSTPINRSTTHKQHSGGHIALFDNDADLHVVEINEFNIVEEHANSNGISHVDLERNLNNVGISGETNSTDKPSQRLSMSNKRSNNQCHDNDFNLKSGCPPKKRKLNKQLNLNTCPNNKNNTAIYQDDTLGSDYNLQMQMDSSSSSQSSTTSVFGKKRGRPSKKHKENNYCLSGGRNSKSSSDDCRVLVTVDAQVHHGMNDCDVDSSISHSRKRLRSKDQIQQNGHRVTGNRRVNRLNSKLRCIENDFDAIDIVTASSSSE